MCKSMSIRELISAASLSQRAFAEILNIPLRTVENWCMGKNKCPDYVLSLIEYKLKSERLISDASDKQ